MSARRKVAAGALFIPLKAAWFDAFAHGSKRVEWRAHGPRWNRDAVRVGRAVVLSRGYGRAHRLRGTVVAVTTHDRADPVVPDAAREIYPDAHTLIGIHIDLESAP